MPTVIQGATRADLVLQAGLVIDMEAESKRLEEGTYLFETLSRKMGGGMQTATRMEHKFRERRLMPCTAIVTAAATAADTAISVDQPGYFHRDDVIWCPSTGEVFIMNEDTGGTSTAGKITVLNKSGSGGISNDIAINSVLVRLVEAHAEGEAIPPAWNVEETEISTYLMQFDQTVHMTDIANAEENYGVRELLKRRRDAWIEMKRGLNLGLYGSQNSRETTSASGPRRHIMRGLNEWLESEAIDAASVSGGITMMNLGLIIRPTKAYDSSSMAKVTICGQNAWVTISQFPDAAVEIGVGEMQEWGVTLKRLITPFGNTAIGYDPMLSAEYGLADNLYILDPKRCSQLQMRGLPLVMKQNVQNASDIHNIKDVITGTRGLKVELPELHRRVKNIS